MYSGRWYDIFDAQGRYLGEVELPQRFELWQAGEDFVLGVRKDDFDVEFVEMYRLGKVAG